MSDTESYDIEIAINICKCVGFISLRGRVLIKGRLIAIYNCR